MKQSLLQEIDSVNAMFVHADDGWGSLFEEITFSLYAGVLSRGDWAIDCGTNHGLHTSAMARACGPSGGTYAIEASPEMMTKTKTKNGQFNTIEYVNRAAWNISNQEMIFNYYPNEDGLSSLRPSSNTSAHVSYEVQTVTIDEVAVNPISLIKLDIEGAEFHALCGAERVMADDRPIIVFENGRATSASRFDYSAEDFFRLFEGRGYQLYSVAGMPLVRENWDSLMPWQFMALHPASPRASRALAVTQAYVYRLRLASN